MSFFYDILSEKILHTDLPGMTVEDRPLTTKEWFRKHIMRKRGDPRIHFEPIKIALFDFDFSDPDDWKMVRR